MPARSKSSIEYKFEKKTGLKLGKMLRNGNGKVYLLKDRPTKVVKISAEYSDTDGRKSFLELVKKLKKMKHPAIVKVYQVGVLPDTYYYYVMDKLSSLKGNKWDRGDTLHQYIYGAPIGSNEPPTVQAFVKQVKALSKKYHYGDVHGGNIMQNERGELKFVDLESFTYD